MRLSVLFCLALFLVCSLPVQAQAESLHIMFSSNRFHCAVSDNLEVTLLRGKGDNLREVKKIRKLVRRLRNRRKALRQRLNNQSMSRRVFRRKARRIRQNIRTIRQCRKYVASPDDLPSEPAPPDPPAPDDSPNDDDIFPPGDRSDEIVPNIKISRTSCVAPCGLFFDATESTAVGVDNPFQNLRYLWDFENDQASFINRPELDASSGEDALAAHVFDPIFEPGEESRSFTVKLLALNSEGDYNEASKEVIVNNPDYIFAEDTLCVSLVGDFNGCPTEDASKHIDTLTGLGGIFMGTDNPGPRRLLFRRGEVFSNWTKWNFQHGDGPYLIGAFGSGDKPVLKTTADHSGFMSFSELTDFTITEIRFEGDYDPTSGIGHRPIGIDFFGDIRHVNVYRNEFVNLGMALLSRAQNNVSNVIYYDNYFEGLHNYTHFGSMSEAAIVGNLSLQSLDAVTGDEGKCGDCEINFPDHGHTIRLPEAQKALISRNKIRTFGGWSSAGTGHQSALRLGTSGLVEKSVISENTFEGGFGATSMSLASSSAIARGGEAIYENNTFIVNRHAETFLSLDMGGSVIRNNKFIKQGDGNRLLTGPLGSSLTTVAIQLNRRDNEMLPEIENAPVVISGNTFVSYDDVNEGNKQARLLMVQVVNNATKDVTITDNILYAPYLFDEDQTSGLLSWSNGDTSLLVSDRNQIYTTLERYAQIEDTIYSLAEWKQLGRDLNSSTERPSFHNAPLSCEALLVEEHHYEAAVATREGLHTRISKPGVRFDLLGVYPGSRVVITSAQGGPGAMDCNRNGEPDEDYNSCRHKDATGASNGSILVSGNLLAGANATVDFTLAVIPGDANTLHFNNYAGVDYRIGDLIRFRYHEEPRTITSIEADGHKTTIGVTPPITEPLNETSFFCLWPQGTTDLEADYELVP